MPRKGCVAAPAIRVMLKSWGRCAPLSRHEAAPTKEGDQVYLEKSRAKKNPAEAGFFVKRQTNYLAWAST
ncbi:hypothetical protein PRtIB026_A22390 [Pseudomonas sp. RtIB026]|nr:hypothetical protein PRtIB026_A22390 [Pseudomonas sp. RtIB026]